MKADGTPLGLYVHWPFCKAKCPYCDFNSHVNAEVDAGAFGAALCREMAHMKEIGPSDQPLQSIFFGGGTPTLMPPEIIEQIINQAERLFGFASDIEISAEANPTSVETAALQGFRAAGVNRISVGVQALRENELAFLGREHSVDEAKAALHTASQLFDRVSADLIYGLPDQSADAWQETLEQACDFGLGHLSLYQLTIEPGTGFYTRQRRGEVMTTSDDNAAALYELTTDVTNRYGLPAYEVSNHARAGQECRHNLIYWRAQNWIGVGPGAHGRFWQDGHRISTATRRSPSGWCKAVRQQGHGIEYQHQDEQADQIAEMVMMGLRLNDGINLRKMAAHFGPVTGWLDTQALSRCRQAGLLLPQAGDADDRLATTRAGRLVLNQILSEVLI